MKRGNLFEPVKRTSVEFIENLICDLSSSIRIERIVSEGDISPENFWYDQDEWEWVTVLQGSATLEFKSEREKISMTAGDWIFISAHEQHRVIFTSSKPSCVWLAVFGKS